jgi:tyrosyl-DNA phosphodiesterase-1
MERAQLEQERLARLKRSCREPHPQTTEPPLKRPSRVRSFAPALEAGPSHRRGRETVDENVEVFWDGELRQTANAHVETGRNGDDGRPVFRLSQIIGDVSPVFLPVLSPLFHSPFTKRIESRNHNSN